MPNVKVLKTLIMSGVLPSALVYAKNVTILNVVVFMGEMRITNGTKKLANVFVLLKLMNIAVKTWERTMLGIPPIALVTAFLKLMPSAQLLSKTT